MKSRYQQTARRRGGGTPRGSQGSALKALRENIDRIYRIAMKISSDWSNQIDLGHSQCPLFSLVNHTDYRDRYIGEDRTTRVRYVGSISLLVCTVSPDGDSRRYGQVVRTIEKEHEPIYSHRDTINSYQSHTVHQSIHLIWIDCKTLNKAYLYMHIQTKS